MPRDMLGISSNGKSRIMRLSDLLAAFDEALEWAVDDPFLADHEPSAHQVSQRGRLGGDAAELGSR